MDLSLANFCNIVASLLSSVIKRVTASEYKYERIVSVYNDASVWYKDKPLN